MDFLLTPEIESKIQQQLAKGFGSPEEVLLTALDALQQEQQSFTSDFAELDHKIRLSLEAADRGETISAEQAKAHLLSLRSSMQP